VSGLGQAAGSQRLEAGGESPGRQAWRRLRKNRLAVIGGVVVILMTLATVLVPWFGLPSPTEEHAWIDARAPGFSRPDCAAINAFTVGELASSSAGIIGARERVAITADDLHYEDYRVSLRRGVVQRIVKQVGGEAVPELIIGERDSASEIKEDGSAGRTVPSGTARQGDKPPAGWFNEGEQVLFVRMASASTQKTYDIALSAGSVSAITCDGDPTAKVILRGENIHAVAVDGRSATVRHLLGTDLKGRDLLSRVLYGGRISLLVGIVATVVSLFIGVIYGAVSGYVGGRVDRTLMAGVDILYAIPFMFLVIVLLVTFGRSLIMLFIALGAVQWLTMARVVRGQVLSLVNRDFIAAARMAGGGHMTILFRHLIPNCMGPIVVFTALTVPAVVLEESFLSFIGLTVQYQGDALDSWGALIKYGVDVVNYRTGDRLWLLLWPSLAMVSTLVALNCLGDGMRDALDPQLKGRQ
jgi:oligopeptide transport system permease protein